VFGFMAFGGFLQRFDFRAVCSLREKVGVTGWSVRCFGGWGYCLGRVRKFAPLIRVMLHKSGIVVLGGYGAAKLSHNGTRVHYTDICTFVNAFFERLGRFLGNRLC